MASIQEFDTRNKRPLAVGRTSEIYPFGVDKIVKLFLPDWPKELAEHEAKVADLVFASDLPVPRVWNLVKINGRLGLIYEKINGENLLDKVKKSPWILLRTLDTLAQLQVQIQQHSISGLPMTKERLAKNISSVKIIDRDIKDALLNLLAKLPEGNSLNHGDFHIGNILATDNGKMMVIDWDDVSVGNRLADVARTALMLKIVNLPPDSDRVAHEIIEIGRKSINPAKHYVTSYSKLFPIDTNELDKWITVNAAARLSEVVPGEKEKLLKIIKDGLKNSDKMK